MKPSHLKIEGFLSYQEPVEIDFTAFDLACITGENGAGKSSIQEAITWVLFGKARKNDEGIINLQSDEAVVSMSFEYSGESYTIQRSNKRGKPGRLTLKTPELDLTERTVRDTQSKIESILRIDYDTFIHAVFFLQGDSDQFVSANSSQRKQVLFDILGLDAWETFRLNAAAKIKEIERGMEQSRGVMGEIEETLLGETEAHTALVLSQTQLDIYEKEAEKSQLELAAQEEKNEKYKTWQQEVDRIESSLATALEKKIRLDSRATEATNRLKEYDGIIDRKEQIQKDYSRATELSGLISGLIAKQTTYVELNNSLKTFETSRERLDGMLAGIPEIEKNIAGWQAVIKGAEINKEKLDKMLEEKLARNDKIAVKQSIQQRLREQIRGLEGHEECPLCRQSLENPDELIQKFTDEGLALKDEIILLREEEATANAIMEEIKQEYKSPEVYQERINTAQETIENIRAEEAEFSSLSTDETKAELAALGFDPEVLHKYKMEMETLTTANVEYGRLETAEKAIEDVKKQMADLAADLESVNNEILINTKELEDKKNIYNAHDVKESQFILATLQTALDNAQQQVMETTKKIGSLEQKLAHLQEQKEKLESIKEKEKDNTALHQKYSILQEAFSKKGVPALLVEQALPQIESKANELLHRLSDGQMAVHFVTQKAYADGSREDMKETLDIEIQDSAGIRDYEMYSGGESFRINFAIRMALSNVLANRAGAKLRTLVIDEGFGSQDAGGRNRLINAINIIKEDYDKVLVISHIPEVIDAFPVQLRVEKGSNGSKVVML